jgi:hypothetical protein
MSAAGGQRQPPLQAAAGRLAGRNSQRAQQAPEWALGCEQTQGPAAAAAAGARVAVPAPVVPGRCLPPRVAVEGGLEEGPGWSRVLTPRAARSALRAQATPETEPANQQNTGSKQNQLALDAGSTWQSVQYQQQEGCIPLVTFSGGGPGW